MAEDYKKEAYVGIGCVLEALALACVLEALALAIVLITLYHIGCI